LEVTVVDVRSGLTVKVRMVAVPAALAKLTR